MLCFHAYYYNILIAKSCDGLGPFPDYGRPKDSRLKLKTSAKPKRLARLKWGWVLFGQGLLTDGRYVTVQSKSPLVRSMGPPDGPTLELLDSQNPNAKLNWTSSPFFPWRSRPADFFAC